MTQSVRIERIPTPFAAAIVSAPRCPVPTTAARDEQIVALAMAGQGPAAIVRSLGVTRGAVEWAIGRARARGVTFAARQTMRSRVEANRGAILNDWATGKFKLAELVQKHGGSEDTIHTLIRQAKAAKDLRALTLGQRNAAGRRSHESDKPQPPKSIAERMGIRIGATVVMFDGSTLYKRRENRVALSAGDDELDPPFWGRWKHEDERLAA